MTTTPKPKSIPALKMEDIQRLVDFLNIDGMSDHEAWTPEIANSRDLLEQTVVWYNNQK